MDTRGQYTREEIFSQPETWKDALDILSDQVPAIQAFVPADHAQEFIFTGCGSTYYLSCAAAASFQEITGVSARGVPASELWLSPRSYYRSDQSYILIAVSRSGETTETLRACEQFLTAQRGKVVTLVCDPGSRLAKLGGLNLLFPCALEKSIAQTRAFSTLYLAALGLSAILAKKYDWFNLLSRLPELCARILREYRASAEAYGSDLGFNRIYFLGSGGRYGIASELNLKMKEMSLTHSEPFHILEFRHGPKAMVNENTLVVALLSEANAEHELAVVRDVTELGAEVITIGENNADISFNSGLEEVLRNILYLPYGQLMAYERSLVKGFDPDHPIHLEPVVKLAALD